MHRTSTHLDLLQFVYGETEPTEDMALREACKINPELKHKLDAYLNAKTFLAGLKMDSPSPILIKAILNYSQDTASIESMPS